MHLSPDDWTEVEMLLHKRKRGTHENPSWASSMPLCTLLLCCDCECTGKVKPAQVGQNQGFGLLMDEALLHHWDKPLSQAKVVVESEGNIEWIVEERDGINSLIPTTGTVVTVCPSSFFFKFILRKRSCPESWRICFRMDFDRHIDSLSWSPFKWIFFQLWIVCSEVSFHFLLFWGLPELQRTVFLRSNLSWESWIQWLSETEI